MTTGWRGAANAPRRAVALDLVQEAVGGAVDPDHLAALLSTWIYEPRHHDYASMPPRLRNPNSLDAVDIAYFDYGLLTDEQYDDIIRTATVRDVSGANRAVPPETKTVADSGEVIS